MAALLGWGWSPAIAQVPAHPEFRERGAFISFEACPYTAQMERSELFWVHKSAILAVGYVSKGHFDVGDNIDMEKPDERIYTDCTVIFLSTGQSTFIKGKPARWEELLELIN